MTLNQAIIQEVTLSQTTASVVIPVPTGYSDLRLVMSLRSSNTESVGVIYFNSDTTNTNYTVRRMLGEGSGTPSSATANYPYIYYMNPSNDTANTYSNHEVYISDYLSSNPKTFLATGARENNGTYGVIAQVPGKWSGTAAINSLTIKPYNEGGASFAAGCTFTLYGITKTGATVTPVPKATGGDIIKNDGTYWYHAFLSTGAFIPQQTLSADVLVVAGGGGSTWRFGGGGGAGGVVYSSGTSLTSGTLYACTVGAGGAAGGTSIGGNGSNSQFSGLTAAIGGGSAGGSARDNGASGGSGGGGGGYTPGIGGAGTAGQGYAGGNGATNVRNGGGGGGAGSVGEIGNANHGGNGGVGTSTYSAWGSATSTGHNVSGTYYYAGGGGGATNLGNGGSDGSWDGHGYGGNGGGGNGGAGNNGGSSQNLLTETAGMANTGGGAGGNEQSSSVGAAGGSGIVIIRYAMA